VLKTQQRRQSRFDLGAVVNYYFSNGRKLLDLSGQMSLNFHCLTSDHRGYSVDQGCNIIQIAEEYGGIYKRNRLHGNPVEK